MEHVSKARSDLIRAVRSLGLDASEGAGAEEGASQRARVLAAALVSGGSE